MGVRITAKDVDAEAYATEYSAPIRRALEAVHFLNGTAEKSAHNYAPGKLSGSVAGAPVATANSLGVKSLANYIQSAAGEAAEMTIFIIARSSDTFVSDANRPMIIGTYNGFTAAGGGTPGLSMFVTDTSVRCAVGLSDTGGSAITHNTSIINTYASVWALYVLRVTSSGVSLRDVTHALTTNTTYPVGSSRRPSTNRLRIGSAFTGFQGIADIAVTQIHSAALTEDEIQRTVTDLRAYAARRGITV